MASPFRRVLPFCAAAAVALWAPHAAGASTLSVNWDGGRISYVAASGETNKLSIAYDAARGAYRVSDPGATSMLVVTQGGDGNKCVKAVVALYCPAKGVRHVAVSLADGNDELRAVTEVPVSADGGPGADTISTGAGED